MTRSNGSIAHQLMASAEQSGRRAAEPMPFGVCDERPPEESDRRWQRHLLRCARLRKPGRERTLGIVPQLVDLRYAVHTAHRAEGRTTFLPVVLGPQIVRRVLAEWYA